jgi:hypothetical protein
MFEDRFTMRAGNVTLVRRARHVLAQLHACALKHGRVLLARTKGDDVASGYIALIIVVAAVVILGVVYALRKRSRKA